MKIRIEGCTAEELAEHAEYLSLGKVYSAVYEKGSDGLYTITDDFGNEVNTLVGCSTAVTSHLPENARWVKVE